MAAVGSMNKEHLSKPAKVSKKYISRPGLRTSLVKEISYQKNEPDWMRKKRLDGYEWFLKTELPHWGPSLRKLDLRDISFFIRPNALEANHWEDVPEEIRTTFDRLGIPRAEQEILGGAGAQFDSDVVYHHVKKELESQGVIFENMDVALQKHPDLVKEYFMTKCIPINDHKFIMLHSAVWSGGTFIYVPKGVKVVQPLQAYFRMNSQSGGQFEHTLIIADEGSDVSYIEGCSAPVHKKSSLHAGCVELFVKRGARLRYTSVENWSKNTFNLNTKRAIVDEEGTIEWINGNMGSGTTMLYPCSILRGRKARSESLGVVFAGPYQHQDTGSKVIHVAPETASMVRSKSITAGGGISTYRGFVRITKGADHSTCSVNCDTLMLDSKSRSRAIPVMKIENKNCQVSHEARVGKMNDSDLFYLQSRGISKERAMQMIVLGFFEPIVKALRLEYAVEFNKLIELEMEGAIG